MSKELDKEKILDKKYKITQSGTFTIATRDVLESENVQRLLKELKPVRSTGS